jgi:hypothetical protein
MLARQIAVGFGIALIFPLLIHYGVATFYPPPKLETSAFATTMPLNPTLDQRQQYMQRLQERQQDQRQWNEAYTIAAKDFARHLVIILTPLGVAAMLTGAYLTRHAIGTGLLFGGIFTVVWGYWGYWSYLDDWVRFVSLLAGFIILLFIGYYRISRSDTRISTV